ncbi:nuclear transport factor 2 family protein [Streptomyces sp. NPDC051172]|uniref:nuclear transport factor 2 family protein n=1 Tax=Streptomyces sp. NPDC051172 TaxID=3155796 RepID=UPI00344A4894
MACAHRRCRGQPAPVAVVHAARRLAAVRADAARRQGRGTNVIVRRDGELKMLHEHLSS